MDIASRVKVKVSLILESVLEEWRAFTNPAKWVVGGGVALFCLLSIWIYVSLLGWWFGEWAQVADAKPRVARFSGLIQSEQALHDSLLAYNSAMERLAYPDTGDSGRSGALLQQQIRQLASQSGATVLGSEVLAPEPMENLVKLQVQVNVSGDAPAIDNLLELIYDASPVLFVDKLELQGRRTARRIPGGGELEETLSAQIWVSAFRVSTQ